MKFLKVSALVIISFMIGLCYGYVVHKNQIFPYKQIKDAYMRKLYRENMNWSIGIYEGTTPFNLADPKKIHNPVISAGNVNDVDAAFVADPFIIVRDEKYFMFFEVLNMGTYSGDIGYAVSDDGRTWDYKKIILDEAFHLSYPCVYEFQGNYYMIPESSEDSAVRLYKATSFPEKWQYIGNLLSGSPFNDPSVFYHNNKYWMLASTSDLTSLNLFYSDSLTSGWQPHPMNPIIKDNKHITAPAGRVFAYEGRLYRLTQDDEPYYGIQVFAVEITELSDSTYKERADSLLTIVTMTNKGWNAAGMHHVDLFKIGNKWNAVVDGIKRRPR